MGKAVHAAAAAFMMFAGGARAQMTDASDKSQQRPMIEVTGSGSVSVKPDKAVITIGVTTDDPNAAAALAKNNAATAKVIAEIEAANIDKKDIQTWNFSIYPQYRNEGDAKHPVLTYRVSNNVAVTIHDLDRIGELLGKAVAAGSNQVSGPNFSVSHPENYLNEARKKAVEEARAKAGAYASAAGASLGAVLYMSDDTSAVAMPRTLGAAGRYAKAATAVPIESGEETLEARVIMVFVLNAGS